MVRIKLRFTKLTSAYETITRNAQMEFINLHLIDVYFMVKLEVDELSKLLCIKNIEKQHNQT